MEFIIAGATGVAIGTSNFTNPYTITEVLKGIKEYLKRKNIKNISEITGTLRVNK
jgi:dihydroorotate dehydrogenase (NAD+) catalytic subunit